MTEEEQGNKGNDQEENVEEKPREKIEGKRNWIHKKAKYLLIGAATLVLIVALGIGGIFFARLSRHRFKMHSGHFRIEQYHNPPKWHRFEGQGQFERRGRFDGPDRFSSGRDLFTRNSITAKVAAVNGQTFAIDENGKTKTVQITDSTRFPLDSTTKVSAGDTVIVSGEQDSKGVIQATHIIVNPQLDKSSKP